MQRHPWLVPDWADADGNIGLRTQAFVVEIDGLTVLVDPCVGNGKVRWLPCGTTSTSRSSSGSPTRVVVPDDVELVVHTHLHADHVGWDTHRDGDAWVPTFTGARHLYTAAELEFSRTSQLPGEDVYGDSIAPIFDAGLADVVEPDADLGHGLRLEPTPGHTPGHTSMWIESDGEHALLTGDFMHHPVQFAEPHLAEIADADVEVARATRAADAPRDGPHRRARARRALPEPPRGPACVRRRRAPGASCAGVSAESPESLAAFAA